MTNQNIYTIPEEYRHSWDATMIAALTQPAAHLDQFAKRFDVEGEYLKLQSIGGTDFQYRKQRHEKIVWDELKLGERLISPIAFGKALGMSKDDFTYKGGLPMTLQRLHDALEAAARPLADRVFLGVVWDEDKRECIIPADGTELSPYHNDATDGVNLVTHDGHYGGILGTMHTGKNGATKIDFPTQPFIGGTLATSYNDYKTSLSALSLRDTNVIPVNYVKGGSPIVESGLTLEKIRAGRLAMVLRHAISASEQVCMAITPWQMEDLLTLEKMENKDYGFGSIGKNEINTFLGVKFLVTVDVPIVNIGGKWVRCCPMWVQRDVGFGIWKNIEYDTRVLPDHWDTVLTLAQGSYGAGRMREESVMAIHCAESGLSALSA